MMEEYDILQERKARILGFIESEGFVPMKRKEMRMMLSVPAEDIEKFDALLDELVAAGQVFESKKGKIAPLGLLQMAIGTFQSHPRGFGFITPDAGGEDIYIAAADTRGAMQNDKVLYKIMHAASPGRRANGVVVKILTRGTQRIVGRFAAGKKGKGFVFADDKKFGREILIPKGHTKGAVEGHKVVVEILDYGTEERSPIGEVVEILGHINDPGVDILSVIRRYELPVAFSEEIYQEIEGIGAEIAAEDIIGREDLRDILTITIDGADAKDLDDAISLKRLENGNFELGVHIADVSHYVKEGTALDQEAYARGTSVYLVDRVIPMLPHKLCNGICSLNPQEDRLALSCMMEIDQRGEVVQHRIAESVIHSDYRMTYTAVREILEDGTPTLLAEYAEILPMLTEMEALRRILGEKREKRGSVNFDLPESKIILDENGKPIDIQPYERSIATNMIEEFMLICNETVAENAYWQELPFLYRSHHEPDEGKMEKLEQFLRSFGYHLRKKDGEMHPREVQKVMRAVEGKDEEHIITRMVLRSMMQARYTAENSGHFGLAAKYYCHFTSPIRRYPDLEIHRMLKKMLHGELDEKTARVYRGKMPDWAQHCSRRERLADDAERDTQQLKKVEYMESRLGMEYEGIISGVTSWGIYVELANTIEGMVPLAQMLDDYYEMDERQIMIQGKRTKKTYRMGDRVRVVVAKVEKEMGTIDFALAEG